MKKVTRNLIYTVASILILHRTNISAQNDVIGGIKGMFELSATIGANSFFGDIGGTRGEGAAFIKDYTTRTTTLLGGGSLTFHPAFWCGIKVGINVTSVNAADSLIKNENGQERWRYYRNASFNSTITEAYLGLELYPLMMFEKEVELHILEPFIGIGAGVFKFNPTAELNGQQVELQPLGLEGQGSSEYPERQPYKLTQFYVPYSFGAKLYINNIFSFSGGIQFRKTFTDYIDDISTTYVDPIIFDSYLNVEQADLARQLYSRSIRPDKVKPGGEKANSSNNDSYTTIFLSLNIRLGDYFRNSGYK